MPLYIEDYDLLGIPEPSEVITATKHYMNENKQGNSILADLHIDEPGVVRLQLNADDIDVSKDTSVKVLIPGDVVSGFVVYLKSWGFSLDIDGWVVCVDPHTVKQGLIRFSCSSEGDLSVVPDVEVIFIIRRNLWVDYIENDLLFQESYWGQES